MEDVEIKHRETKKQNESVIDLVKKLLSGFCIILMVGICCYCFLLILMLMI